MPMRRSDRRQVTTRTRKPNFIDRLLNTGGSTGHTSRTSTKGSSPLFSRKKKSHTPVIGLSNNNTPTIGSNSNKNPITGKKKSGPLFGRRKRTGPAAIVNPNNSGRQESIGEKFNRIVSGKPRKSGLQRKMDQITTPGTKRNRWF